MRINFLKNKRLSKNHKKIENYLLKLDIAETTHSAIEFLNPELDKDDVISIYVQMLVTVVPEKELTKMRDTMVSLADTKVKEVNALYKIYERSN
jgi:hypothetical protein